MMQSGEAQATGASRQHSGTSVLKGKGSKGKKFSLAQLLFGLIPATGLQAKPFGKVLRQLQGKLPVLGKSQSRLQAKKGSGITLPGGTVSSSRSGVVTPKASNVIGEAAKQTWPSAQGATPIDPQSVAPASSVRQTPMAIPAGRGQVAPAPAPGNAPAGPSLRRANAGQPTGSISTASISPESHVPAKDVNPNILAKDVKPNALTKGVDPNDLTKDVNPNALTKGVDPNGLTKGVNPNALTKDVNPNALTKDVNPNVLTKDVNPNVLTKGVDPNVLIKDVKPDAPVSNRATPSPTPIDGAGQTVPGTLFANQVAPANPDGQTVPSGNGNAKRTGNVQPQRQRSTPVSAKTVAVPGNKGHQPATAQRDASVDTPRPLTQVQTEGHAVKTTPQSVAPTPVKPTLAAVSDKPTAPTTDRGTPAIAPRVVARGAHALPAIDDKSVPGTGQRPSAPVTPRAAPAVVQQVHPHGLAPDLPAASFAGAVEGNTGDGKRLDVRSSRPKRSPITFVQKSDGGKTPDVQTASAARPAARADSRPAAQVTPQAQDVGVKGQGANTEPVVNSLTINDRPGAQIAVNGNGELKIMNPVELGTQGSTETGSKALQVPVAPTPTLTQPLNSAAPHLANLARMTVVHYNRYVSGSQNQNVFQVDGGSFGNVKITFSEASAGTTLSIMVDRPELQQQLQRALPQLQQEWSNLNLNLGQVNVQVSDSHRDKAFNGEEGLPKDPMKQSTEDVDVPVAMAMERAVDYGYNTVSYIA